MTGVRTLLVTGAGGAGRTCVAAATAAAAARAGTHTLLLTAASGAVLDPLLPPAGQETAGTTATGLPQPYSVDGVDGLYVARTDPAAAYRAGALDLQDRIGSLLGMLGAAPLDPEELTELPGAGALAVLRALREARGPQAAWDLVVVDLPPAAEAVRLLALPEQLRRYLRRLLPADRQAARALRPVLAQLAGVPMPAEWAFEAAARADAELGAVQTVIDDPATAAAVVVAPDATAEAVLRSARTGLALFGHRLAGVVANRVLPTGSADPFLAGLSGHQQDVLKLIADQCATDGVPLYERAHLGRPPQGVEEGLAVPVDVPGPQAPAPHRPPEPWTVEDRLGADGHFLWSLPLPGAGREGLDLVRRGDELVVDAGGFRRIVPLPSALRRCAVAGAALRDGALSVRFTPDPDLWPR
ncbi:ArsA family ATPase [Streptomyces sp. PLK6-54]|uniref:ArsA family ATPase n=1 Tax=Actinacidiphila acidipaludis TaxID=2873382 RepID=A0ABS7Q071_9ACTN|nr:ArsA family ATPase [Streptomyces acidipaludis]